MPYTPREPRKGEPVFTLMGSDALAPAFCRAYGYMLQGQTEMAEAEMRRVFSRTTQIDPDPGKAVSAFHVAGEMQQYQRDLAIQR